MDGSAKAVPDKLWKARVGQGCGPLNSAILANDAAAWKPHLGSHRDRDTHPRAVEGTAHKNHPLARLATGLHHLFPNMHPSNIQSSLILIEAYLAVQRAKLRRGPRL